MVLGLVGASRSGGAIRGGGADDGTARAEAERRAGQPRRVGHAGAHGCTCSAWGCCALLCAWLCVGKERGREKEERRREKEKEKKKKREGKSGKGEKEKETPVGFATTVASRAWRRREATRTRNEETGKVLNDD